MIDRLVYIGNEFFLSFPVWKRKCKLPDRSVAPLQPVHAVIGPFPVLRDQRVKPKRQFLKRIYFLKIFYSFRL